MNIQTQIGWFFSALLTVACGAPVDGDDMDFSDTDPTADEAPKKAKSDDADKEEVENDKEDVAPEGLVVNGFEGQETIYPEASDFFAQGNTLFVTDPATDRVYAQTPDGEWYPEGTDRISEEASEEIDEIIAEVEEEEEVIERYAQVVTVENILPEDVTMQGLASEIIGVFRLQNHWGNWNHLQEVCFRSTGTGDINDLAGVKVDSLHSYAEPAFTRTEDLDELNGSFCLEVAMTLGAEEEAFLSFAIQTPMGEVLNDMWGTTYQFEITSISLEWGSDVRGLPAATGLVTMERSQ